MLGFPDYDAAGITGMSRWRKQLNGIAAEFEVFDYTGMIRDDGKPVKDLRDFLHIDVDQWVHQPVAVFRENFTNFQGALFT
jgi:hypothetical protein